MLSWGARQSPRGARPGRPPLSARSSFSHRLFLARAHTGTREGMLRRGKKGGTLCAVPRVWQLERPRLETVARPCLRGAVGGRARCASWTCLCAFWGGVRGRHFSINACKYEPNRFVPYRAVRLMRCRCGRAGCGGCVRGPCALGGAGVCGWCGGFNCVPSTRGAGRERNRKLL